MSAPWLVHRYPEFWKMVEQRNWQRWAPELEQPLRTVDGARRNSDRNEWETTLELSKITPTVINLSDDLIQVGVAKDLVDHQITSETLTAHLKRLHPWRKGPFSVFGIHLDTEWRSDFKWRRISPHISDLTDRVVMDVGCGSGYHAWRMIGAGAKNVLAIDPSQLFWTQFRLIQSWIANALSEQPSYLPNTPVQYLPIPLESVPKHIQAFDTVFSMGVLYHRKSPFEHLDHLRSVLRKGGEIILETLVVEGDVHTVFVPPERYAVMNNVWCIPSSEALMMWMRKIGFENVNCVDVNQTTIQEQRSTEWMTWQSLPDFLDPTDLSLTVEGHPAPRRATIIANRA